MTGKISTESHDADSPLGKFHQGIVREAKAAVESGAGAGDIVQVLANVLGHLVVGTVAPDNIDRAVDLLVPVVRESAKLALAGKVFAFRRTH